MHPDFRIGRWLVRPSQNVICQGGQSICVRPRSMDVLVFLYGRHGDVVSRDEILSSVWSGVAVSDDTLTQAIVELRKAFDDGPAHQCIQTFAKRGYRLALEALGPDHGPAADEAQQNYLWGRHQFSKRSWAGLRRAEELFSQALQDARNHAPAHAWYAITELMLAYFSPGGREAAYQRAEAGAARALEIDNRLADGHLAAALLALLRDGQLSQCEAGLQKALRLDAASAWSHWALAWVLSSQARHQEAIAHMERARRLEPVNAYLNACVGEICWFAGRDEQALAEYRRLIALDPSFYRAYELSAMLFESRRRYEEALGMRQLRAITSGAGGIELRGLRDAFSIAGERGYWQFLLESGWAPEDPRDFHAANLYAYLGQPQRALAALEEDLEAGGAALLLPVTPKLRPLHSQQRFRRLLQKAAPQ